MKLSRVSRLIQLLNMLQSGRGYNSKDLADICGISRRTVFRDLEVLKEAGVSLAFDEDQQRYFITGRRYLPPTSFTTDEALTMMLLCHELGNVRGLPFFGSARTASLKIESSLPEAIREHLRSVTASIEIQLDPRNQLAGSEATYQQLMDAIASHRCVRIVYDSLTEQDEICTRLSPYRMLFSRRSWYVIGRSSVHREVRTFNVGRVKRLEVLNDAFKVPKGFSLSRYLGNAWHMIPAPGPDRDVWIRFQPLVAQNVAEVVWHRTQHVVFRDDGSLDFRVQVSGIEEISWWVMGYGAQAEVVEPVELREIVAKNCLRMSQTYARELARFNAKASQAGA